MNNNMLNIHPPIAEQQRQQQMLQKQKEQEKIEAIKMGEMLKKQRDISILINENRKKREEEERKKRELTLIFKHGTDELALNFTDNQLVCEALDIYLHKTRKNNVKFFFKGNELKINDNSAKALYEVEGLRSLEEIIVVSL